MKYTFVKHTGPLFFIYIVVKWNELYYFFDMSYKDIKVTSNGGFYVESKDLFKNKKEVLERLKRLQAVLNRIKLKK